MVIQGYVTGISGSTFIVNSEARSVTVETDEMAYNPLDDEGFQKVDIGDRVSVRGEVDENFWGNKELVADTVITLSNES